MNVVLIEDGDGEVIDVINYCCDSHAQTDPNYAGWYGAYRPVFTMSSRGRTGSSREFLPDGAYCEEMIPGLNSQAIDLCESGECVSCHNVIARENGSYES